MENLNLSTARHKAFDSAKNILESNDDEQLSLAALELRRCLEAIVYEKLWVRKKWIPQDIARKWQPPQAFEALLALEPDAEYSATLAIAPETTPGVMAPAASFRVVGVDERPRLSWLKKTYNKLGSFLHVPSPFTQPKARRSKQQREDLTSILGELERFIRNDISFSFENVVEFECHWCKTRVSAHPRALEEKGEVQCWGCNAKLLIERKGEEFIQHPDISIATCSDCQESIDVPTHLVTSGYQFSCTCGCTLEVNQVWEISKVHSESEATPAPE